VKRPKHINTSIFFNNFQTNYGGPEPKYNSQNLNKFDVFQGQQHVGSPRRL
jgi:hypothetical protein